MNRPVEAEEVTAERGGLPARVVSFLSRRSIPFVLVLGAGLRIGLFLGNERRFFLEHLDGMRTKLEAFEEPGASAFLYDLRPGSVASP